MCDDDADDDWLDFSFKNAYRNHRKWLPRFHPYRKMKARLNGITETRVAREPPFGMQMYEKVQNVSCVFGKTIKKVKGARWKKKSIFWDLPYWKYSSIRHLS